MHHQHKFHLKQFNIYNNFMKQIMLNKIKKNNKNKIKGV